MGSIPFLQFFPPCLVVESSTVPLVVQEVGRLWQRAGRQAAELEELRSQAQRSSELLERLRHAAEVPKMDPQIIGYIIYIYINTHIYIYMDYNYNL